MTVNAGILSVLISLLFLSGCTNRPVFTVEVYETPTSVQVVLDPVTATPSPQAEIPLVPTNKPILESVSLPAPTVPAVMPPDFSPILYGKKYDANMFFIVLGAVQGNTWLAPKQAVAQFGGEWDYDVHTFAQRSFPVRGYNPTLSPPSRSYFIGTDTNFDEFGMVGVLHAWPVRQGNVQELSPDIDEYKQVVADWLKSEGVSAAQPGVVHIFRVDLEADGVDEIFISATLLDESQHYTRAGDHSLILMRKVVGNEAVTLPIVSAIYHSQDAEITYPATYSLGNFIDLNRDGILEVVVELERWEGFGAIVFQVDGQEVVERLRQE